MMFDLQKAANDGYVLTTTERGVGYSPAPAAPNLKVSSTGQPYRRTLVAAWGPDEFNPEVLGKAILAKMVLGKLETPRDGELEIDF